jgi:hypothetical protein
MKDKNALLWFDDNPGRSIEDKIGQAAHRYRMKHSVQPNVCYVHPSVLSDNSKVKKVGDVRVAALPTVLVHHFWIGIEGPRKVEAVQGRLP